MSLAAYKKKVQISLTDSQDDGDWLNVPCTSPSLSLAGEVLDDTNLAMDLEDEGFRSKILGIKDWSVSCDSNYDSEDTALQRIRQAFMDRSKIWVRYLPTGQVAGGFKGRFVVENYNLSGEVAGLEVVALTLQGSGKLVDS